MVNPADSAKRELDRLQAAATKVSVKAFSLLM